jgi:hypothetical protein
MRKMLFLLFLIFSVVVSVAFATTIYDIQYTTIPGPDNTYPSPLEGQTVTVEGVVTGFGYYTSGNENRFFISEPEGGAWRGVFVFNYDFLVEQGDLVEVTGEVCEYWGLTELSYITNVTIISSGYPVPEPIVIQTADLVDAATAEQYEGCLVELNDVIVTQAQDGYGQWYVTDTSAIPCQIDDAFFQLENVVPPIVITVGMEWAIIRGCVDYGFDEYGINPRTPDDLIDVVSINENTVELTCQFLGCYPNPFNPETNALLSLKQESKVVMAVYNIKGEKVKTLVNGNLPAGMHTIPWNGTDENNLSVASGIYFFKTDARDNLGDYTSLKKVILLK